MAVLIGSSCLTKAFRHDQRWRNLSGRSLVNFLLRMTVDFDLLVLGRTPEAWAVATAARKCRQQVLLATGETPAFADDWPAAELLARARQRWEIKRGNGGATRPGEAVEEAVVEMKREHGLRLERWRQGGGCCVEGACRLEETINGGVRLRVNEENTEFRAPRAWVATGDCNQKPAWAAFDAHTVLTPGEAIALTAVPRSAIVVGAGTKGIETARFLVALGTRVLLVDRQPATTLFASRGERLERWLMREGIGVLSQSEVISVVPGAMAGAEVQLVSGEVLHAQTAWLTTESRGRTAHLGFEPGQLATDERGRVWCDANLRSSHAAVRVAGAVAALHGGVACDPGLLRQRVWEEARSIAAREVPTIPDEKPVLWGGRLHHESIRDRSHVACATCPVR